MEETTKDAALLVDPLDINDITHAMERLVDDANLREMLIEKGHKRAKHFSWETAARKINEILKALGDRTM